jgi:pantoate--beta-alanine ligase
MSGKPGPAPIVVADACQMRDTILTARRAGRKVGFVPTMGALHAGHASLVEQAAAECDDVVVSIFVNPKQFGPREDLARYPRTLPADLALVGAKGARWVFVPEASTAYPAGHATSVVVAAPAADFEGAVRPGHFAGVATVVCWLFNVVPADVAYFGAKDWQQTVVVRRMVSDLAIPIAIEVCPTIREPDGLAMSSRNAYLSPEERHRAVALHEGLVAAAARWQAGDDVAVVEETIRAALRSRDIPIDYAQVVDPDTLLAPRPGAAAVALVAGRVGTTRLLDNALLPPRP